MLRHALEGQDYVVAEAVDEPGAVAALRVNRPSVVLTDLRLPQGDGFGVLRAAKELDPEISVIVMTAYGSIEDAVAAMKEGATDFLAKPVDPDHLLLLVSRAVDRHRILTENMLLKEELATRRGLPEIVGQDASLKQVVATLRRAAESDATVLLGGESGTGKELFAQALHAFSARAEGPFVAINWAAIPETLLESELFGHEKGSFTGAVARKPGRFEIAHHGTLFLDEIGDLPFPLQAKILRAIEERTFERVGGTIPLNIDVRIVAAREFREDLGEFNWSSQHLDDEVLRCRDGNGDGQTGRVGLRCVRLVGRRQRGVRSSNGSGRRSRGGCRVRMPLCPVACRRPWVVVGSVRAVVCRRSAWRPDRLAPCPLRSGKRSRSCELRAPGCATLPVGSVEPRRLSHVSCVATRRLGAAVWRIGRRLRSGTATDVPSARREPSWPRTIGSGATCRTTSPAR